MVFFWGVHWMMVIGYNFAPSKIIKWSWDLHWCWIFRKTKEDDGFLFYHLDPTGREDENVCKQCSWVKNIKQCWSSALTRRQLFHLPLVANGHLKNMAIKQRCTGRIFFNGIAPSTHGSWSILCSEFLWSAVFALWGLFWGQGGASASASAIFEDRAVHENSQQTRITGSTPGRRGKCCLGFKIPSLSFNQMQIWNHGWKGVALK